MLRLRLLYRPESKLVIQGQLFQGSPLDLEYLTLYPLIDEWTDPTVNISNAKFFKLTQYENCLSFNTL